MPTWDPFLSKVKKEEEPLLLSFSRKNPTQPSAEGRSERL
jgi:hypothetical protein